MATSRNRLNAAVLVALSAMGINSILPNQGKAAVVTYLLDVNGATSGFGITASSNYDWDATTNGGFWDVSAAGTGPTIGWQQGNFPKFAPASNVAYTVTVTNNEQVTGIFASTAQTLTIAASGSGALEAIDTGSADGFLGSSSADVTITAPIKGAGIVNPSNGGNIRFNAANSYTGGTSLTSTSTSIHFNNNNAFGTNTITNNVANATGFAPLLASGGTTVTLPNNFAQGTSALSGAGINFAADINTPTVSTGDWSLGALNLSLRNNGGNAASTLTLTGKIGGTAGITLSSNTSGIIIFSGANTYSGPTTITGPGGTGTGTTLVRLKLGAAGTIASSSQLILAGGVLDPDGINQDMSANTTLALATSTGASTIDYGTSFEEVDFKNSSAVAWTASKVLNLANWNPSFDRLRFGTDGTGLTTTQLNEIEFNGVAATLGTARITADGYVVPEPASLSLIGLGAMTLLARRRRA